MIDNKLTPGMNVGGGGNRHGGISHLRILASISVVWLHMCSLLADYRELFELNDSQFLFYQTTYYLMRWAVPCFFMITGALLIGRQIEYPVLLKKYVLRIFLALLIFGIPFGLIKIFLEEKTVSVSMIGNSLLMIAEGKASVLLWYLYALIGIYLIHPVLNKIVELPKNTLYWLLSVLFVFNFALPFLASIADIEMAFYIPMGYTLFYVLIGYCVKNDHLPFLNYKWVRITGIVIPVITIILSCKYRVFPKELISYQSPLIALCSTCVFAVFMNIKGEKNARHEREKRREIVWKVDRLCFGVYLIHPVVIQMLYRFLKMTPVRYNHYVVATMISYLEILVICFAGSKIMSLIKPLKKYVL